MATEVAGTFRSQWDGFLFANSWTYDEAEINQLLSLFSDALAVAEGALSPLISIVAGPVIATEIAVCGPFAPICIAETISNINDAIISSIKNSLSVGTYGRCGGMAFAAADYFYKNWVVPQGTGANDQPDTSTPEFSALRSYIWQRLIDSIENNVDTWVYWMAALNLDPSGGPKWLRDHTLLQFETLKSIIDAGNMGLPAPIGLVYPTLNPFDNHQVLVYGYKDNGDQTGSLYVYDNNAPGVESVIDLNLQGNALVTTRDDCRVHASPEPGPLQGFFCSAYTAKTPPLSVVLEKGLDTSAPCGGMGGRPNTVSFTAKNVGYHTSTPLMLQIATSAGDTAGETTPKTIPQGGNRTVEHSFALKTLGRLTFTAAACLGKLSTLPIVKTLPPSSNRERVHAAVTVLPALKISVAGAPGEPTNAAGQRQKWTVDTSPLGSGPFSYQWAATPGLPVRGSDRASVIDLTLPDTVGTEIKLSVDVTTPQGCTATGSITFFTTSAAPRLASLVFVGPEGQAVTGVNLGEACTGVVKLDPVAPQPIEVDLGWFLPGFATTPGLISVLGDEESFAVQAPTAIAPFSPTSGQLSASYAGQSVTAVLDILPPAGAGIVHSVSVLPDVIRAGSSTTGQVTLESAVNTPTTVMLRLVYANPAAVAIPASVNIPAGETTTSFQVDTSNGVQGRIGIEAFAFATALAEFQVSPVSGSGHGPIDPVKS